MDAVNNSCMMYYHPAEWWESLDDLICSDIYTICALKSIKISYPGRIEGQERRPPRDKRVFFRALFSPIDHNLHRDEQESQDHRYYQGSNRLSD